MTCPSCGRPVATARPTCLYCGASLPEETQTAAAEAAARVLQAKNLSHLEASTGGFGPEAPRRVYVILDTTASIESIVDAFGISPWEAQQWQIASSFRLVRIAPEGRHEAMEAPLVASRHLHTIPEKIVTESRTPRFVEFVGASPGTLALSLEDPETLTARRLELEPSAVLLIVSGPIKREKVREAASYKKPSDTRLDDGWLIHLHTRDDPRPLEIDPGRTKFETSGPASAHMLSLELVRRLENAAVHDAFFRNVVPALSPGADPLDELREMASAKKGGAKEPKRVVLDNMAQFREYSAWRAAIERRLSPP